MIGAYLMASGALVGIIIYYKYLYIYIERVSSRCALFEKIKNKK